MNIQTGIDLVELEQIKKSIQNPRFLTRFFSPQEQSLFANTKKLAILERLLCK